MKKSFRNLAILIMVFSILFIFQLEIGSAQQYLTYVGKVVSIHRGTLSVKGEKGEIVHFAVGRRTVYVPSGYPAVGQRVKVSYLFQKGYNVGYRVEILPPAPPPKKTKK